MTLILALALASCGRGDGAFDGRASPETLRMIDAASRRHGVPPDLVRETVAQESGFDARARNGPYYGLMQIDPSTARSMGYRGRPAGLLDPATNLEYGVKYLRGAWLVADGDADEATELYRRGYYFEAKRKGLLDETGLR